MTREEWIVPPDELAENLESVTVVDVREERDYADLEVVPGAVNVPAARFRDPSSVAEGMLPDAETYASVMSEAGIGPDDPLVAYDDGCGVDAARFLLTAAVYGHRGDLAVLDGGIDAWRRSQPTESETPTPGPTDYEPVFDDEPIVDREGVEEAVDGDAVVVDTRTPAEYGESHIPGAIQLGVEDLLEKGGDGLERLKPAGDLESALKERGITPDRRIVLYCNTARRLSYTYLVLRHLGYEDVEFYEGSLTDWVRAEAPEWDPLQLYEDVRRVAPQGFDAIPRELGEDVFSRLHLLGLYTTRQEGYFMLRTKVPGGRLTAEQARTFGEIADEFARAPPEHGGGDQNPVFGDGFLDVTTRQGLQMHWIRIEDMPEIWDRYAEVGLTTIQASGNTLRNVVSCPAAGLGEETLDVRGVASDLADAFEGSRRYANLPRKFKVSFAGCHENCGRAEIQDLGFTPAVKDGRDGFHVKVGGGLSDGPRAATDLGVFVEPEQVEELALAAADLFIDHGSYIDTAVNRLKFIVEEWGVERFREELGRYVDFEFEPAGEDLTTDYRGDHVGVHEQADGRYYVGLNVPTGRMLGSEFVELANLAQRYGSGELRLSINQNVLVPDVPEDSLEDFLGEPLLSRYSPDPGPFSRGIVTCTGREFCKYGVVETKSRAYRWARALDEWVSETDRIDEDDLPEAFRVHMSGCSASCAQPQVADVGLRGERFRDDYGSSHAADVGLGGDLGESEFIDWIAGSVPIDEIPSTIGRTVAAYAAERDPEDSFTDWVRRRSNEELWEVLVDETATNVSTIETEVS